MVIYGKVLRKSIAFLLLVSLLAASSPMPALVYAEDASSTPPDTAVETPSAGTGQPSDPAPGDSPDSSSPAQSTGADAPQDTVVSTGDANSGAGSSDQVNTVDVTASSTADAVIAVVNDATTTATTTASADTGGNTATTTDGTATVATGNAYANANGIQVVNTNLVNSDGTILFQDLFGSLGIDIRNLDLSYFTGSSTGASSSCAICAGATSLSIFATSTATTSASISANANTGGNLASSTDGNALIGTGNAYASANGVQIVNSNLINTNYLILALNNFGSIVGDITLPGADFFAKLLASTGSVSGPLSATIANSATTSASTNTDANTGDNTASTTDGSATIETGNAAAYATNYSLVNSTAVGGSSIYVLLNILGTWSGQVFGLPAGLTMERSGNSIIIRDSGTGAGGNSLSGPASVDVNNTAVSDLNVNASASTGDNTASSTDGSSVIRTGDAFSAANSLQVVNSTILGQNWIHAIVNVFGNLTGNIAFGHPDLWIGAAVHTGNPTRPGDTVHFVFTVANHGDADATNVRLATTFNHDLLQFKDGTETGDGSMFVLGTIPKGTSKEFSYDAQTGAVAEGGTAAALLAATLTSSETDNNPADNTDHVSVTISNPALSRTITPNGTAPQVLITKVADVATTTAPGAVHYTITVQNNGEALLQAVLTDTLTGPDGAVVKKQTWNLDTLLAREKVVVTYTLELADDALLGDYNNIVLLTNPEHPDPAKAPYAKDTVHVEAGVCPQYLTSFIKFGASNDPEQVKKLQDFLINNEGETGVTMSGTYDQATFDAVKRFQQKYRNEIITPWGATAPSGYVYFTTEQKINNLYCHGARTFDLSESQLSEIAHIHTLLTAPPVSQPTGTGSTNTSTSAPEIGLGKPSDSQAARLAEDSHTPASPQPWWKRLFGSASSSLLAGVLSAGIFGR